MWAPVNIVVRYQAGDFEPYAGWALFGEWKFNHASIDHKDLAGTGLNLSADYNAHSLVFGVGYHF
jgi:hypothetical protein